MILNGNRRITEPSQRYPWRRGARMVRLWWKWKSHTTQEREGGISGCLMDLDCLVQELERESSGK